MFVTFTPKVYKWINNKQIDKKENKKKKKGKIENVYPMICINQFQKLHSHVIDTCTVI